MTGASFMGNNQFMAGGMLPAGDVKPASGQMKTVEDNTEVADWISRFAKLGTIISLLFVFCIPFFILTDEDLTFASALPVLMAAIMSLIASVGMLGFSWVVRACIVYLNNNGYSPK